MPLKRSKSELAGNAALLLASIALSLALVELGMRVVDGVPITQFPNFVSKQLDLVQDFGDSNRYDPLLGWRLKENLRYKASPGAVGFNTGDYGVRMNSGNLAAVPHNAILAIGDSFTLGSEVDDHESWPAHLERLAQVNVVNAANGGYGVDQIVLRAEQLAAELSPKVIVAVFLSWDIYRNAFDLFGGGGKPYFTVEDGKLVHHNNPVKRISATPNDIGWSRVVLGRSYAIHKVMSKINADRWIDNGRRNRRILPTETAISSSCLLIERLARLGLASKTKVVVGFVYGGSEVAAKDIPSFVPPVISCARQTGLEVVDVWGSLIKLPPDELKKLYVMHPTLDNIWGHLSSAGNQYVANALCRRLPDCQDKLSRKD